MQNPTQAQAINNVTHGQMPPLRQKKMYEANVLHVARQRTEERIVKLADGRRVKVIRTYSMVRQVGKQVASLANGWGWRTKETGT